MATTRSRRKTSSSPAAKRTHAPRSRPTKEAKETKSPEADGTSSSPREGAPRRALWTGTLGFGLLQIPVSVHPLERSHEVSFHQLDGRDMSPVGYKRYNKATGEEVPYEEIVRGYEVHKGEYVVIDDEELAAANVKATQSIDILDFVDPSEIPTAYFETPYLLAPAKRGEKAYAVLREALQTRGRAAIATVVLRQRQHLAAVLAQGDVLVLELLRFAHELRAADAAAANVTEAPPITDRERQMAEALVDDMTTTFEPDKYKDSYRDDVLAMIDRKVRTGKAITPDLGEAPAPTPDTSDLAALLARSLKRSLKKAS